MAETGDAAYVRSDARDHTLVYVRGDTSSSVGLELRTDELLHELAERLGSAGYEFEFGNAQACAERKARALLRLMDQSGNQIELVVRPLHSGWRFSQTATRA